MPGTSSTKSETETPKMKWYKRSWGIILLALGAAVLIALLVLGGLVAYYYNQIKSGKMPLPPSAKFSRTSASASAPEKLDSLKILPAGEPGSSPEAPFAVVGFFDFQCPYSKEASSVMRELQTYYGDRVNFVFRNFPLSDIHPEAMKAAKAGECANLQDKFWPMHDKLFSNDDWSDETLKLYAEQIGLDENKFIDCLNSEQGGSLVLKDMLDGQALGVRGTPTWFIDNQKVEGDISADAFKKVLDYLLTKQK